MIWRGWVVFMDYKNCNRKLDLYKSASTDENDHRMSIKIVSLFVYNFNLKMLCCS